MWDPIIEERNRWPQRRKKILKLIVARCDESEGNKSTSLGQFFFLSIDLDIKYPILLLIKVCVSFCDKLQQNSQWFEHKIDDEKIDSSWVGMKDSLLQVCEDGGINKLFLLAWSILQRHLDLDNRTSRGILWNKRISSIIHVRRQLTHREKSIDELSMWKVGSHWSCGCHWEIYRLI